MNHFGRKVVATAASLAMAGTIMMPALVGAQGKLTTEELFGGTQGAGSEAVAGALGQESQPLTLTVARIIRNFLFLLGIVAVIIIMIAGFEWMMAGGNEEQVGKAKKRLLQAVIGLAIILSAFSIAFFIVNSLQTATSTAGL